MKLPLLICLVATMALGCEADGLIWMPPSRTADALFRVVINGRAGYIDAAGHIVIPPTLRVSTNWSQAFYDGLLSLGVSNGPFLDASGRKVLDNGFFRIWDFSDGVAPAMKTRDSQWGYIDHSGRFVIQPQFPFYPDGIVSGFSDGLAAIELSGKVGYIDHTGKFVIPPQFSAGKPFQDGTARVAAEGPCVYADPDAIDPCLIIRTAPETGRHPADSRTRLPSCKWHFIDRTGQKLGPEELDGALPFQEELAGVKIGGVWGFIDSGGRMAIAPRFKAVHSFSDGLALVENDSESGFISKSGDLKIRIPYTKAEPFSDGLSAVGSPGEGYTYMGVNGKQAFEGRFVLASRFHHGVAHVKLSGGTYGMGTFAYIDKTGKRIFTYQRDPRSE